jgi:Transmembrane domain of unknown function (DUF3566)
MESVADDIGPETAVRPPARKPGSVPSTAQQPLVDDHAVDARAVEPWPVEPQPTQAQRTQPAPRPQPAPAPRPAAAPRPAPAPVAQVEVGRRYRQTIHRVDLWSVLKIAVCFYICGMAVTMVALVALWLIADAAGVIHSVEKFFGDLLQTKDFTFLDGEILRGALLVSAVLVVLQIVITVIAAAFYNVFAELFGGVEITISEDESTL